MDKTRQRAAPPGGRRAAKIARRFLPVAVLVAGFAAFFAFGLHRYVSLAALRENRDVLETWVADYGIWAAVGYILVYALAVAFSVPGAVFLTIAGGFMFGAYLATLYVMVGATAGAVAVFLAARYAFRDYFIRKVGGATRRMEAGFRENELSYMFILRLVPIFPFWLVNLVPAFLGVSIRNFLVGTVVGIIPGALVYSLVGAGAGAVLDAGGDIDLGTIFHPRFLAPILGLALLACVPVVYKAVRRRRGKPVA